MSKKREIIDEDGVVEVRPVEKKRHNARGAEILDTTPVEVPLNYRRPETLEEKMRRVVHGALSEQAAAQGKETFEESNDFDVGPEDGEPDLFSPHQLTDMEEEISESAKANADMQEFARRNPGKIQEVAARRKKPVAEKAEPVKKQAPEED